MKIQRKIIFIVGGAYLALIAAAFLGGGTILLGGFERLEREIGRGEMSRVKESILTELFHLEKTGVDWAGWDATYMFIEDLNPKYMGENVTPEALKNLDLDFMLFADLKGRIRFGKGYDSTEEKELTVPPSLGQVLEASGVVMNKIRAESSVTGILPVSEGMLMLTVQPILTSERKGPVRGALLMARILDGRRLAALSKEVSLPLTLHGLSPDLPDVKTALVNFTPDNRIVVRPLSETERAGYLLLNDVYDRPVAVLRTLVPRKVYEMGYGVFVVLVTGLAFVALGMTSLLVFLLRRFVVRRIELISGEVRRIRSEGDLESRLPGGGADELGVLSSDINEMLSRLEQSSEEKYRDLFENAMDPIFILGTDFRYRDANRRATEVFGFSREEFLAMSPIDLIPPEQAQRSEEAFSRLRAEGSYEHFVGKMKGNDGRYRDIEVSSSAIVKNGRLVGSRDIVRDVTERMEADRALAESERRFRLLFEQNRDAMLLVDRSTLGGLDANEAALRLFQVTRDTFYQPGFMVSVEGGQRILLVNWLGREALEPGFSGEIERSIISDGARKICRVRFGHMRLGRTDAILIAFRDVTEEVLLEEKWREGLKHLIQSERLSFIGTMVTGFAHDINNPNQLIAGNVEIARDIWKDAEILLEEVDRNVLLGGFPVGSATRLMPQMLEDIKLGSDRIAALIREVAALARTDKPDLEDRVDLNQVLDSAVALLRHRLHEVTDRFTIDKNPRLPPILGSRQKLEQVVINLLVNAMEALRSRSEEIRVTTAFDSLARQVVLVVSDEGGGMSPETLHRCRELFFTTKAESGGTGLGMAISQIFIKEHGGMISVKSTEHEGCKVTVRLPAEKADDSYKGA